MLDALCSGSGARLALGTTVLAYLIAYNEAAAPGLLFATLLATVYGAMAGECSNRIPGLPYTRFYCMYFAVFSPLQVEPAQPTDALCAGDQQIRLWLPLSGHLDGCTGCHVCLCSTGTHTERLSGCHDWRTGAYTYTGYD